ncbi:uncharacterized protein LOC131929219 [Physella acuta]|uniref:uncharacterized protein LOC131929219 n=1 Tax=Physella acuta TaxID=109671 RepID=UPI0027DE135F|nr:uncharacterized protein LOC131929219 [Physella acuta]
MTLILCVTYLLLLYNLTQGRNNSFLVKIEGHEKDCKVFDCRYTGRVYGHFWQPYDTVVPLKTGAPCHILVAQFCADKLGHCDRFYMWQSLCAVWTVCEFCEIEGPKFNDRCTCKPGDPSYFAINTLGIEKPWIRLVFFQSFSLRPPDEKSVIAYSNAFNHLNHPENWNPTLATNGDVRLAEGINQSLTYLLALCLFEVIF